MSVWKKLLWLAVSGLGVWAIVILALSRGEQISALWIIVAGLCSLCISYRFYSKWLAAKVLVLNDERATPAILQNYSKDYVPTNRAMTIPVALIMGIGLRTGKVSVMAVTIFGLLGLAFGVWGGQFLAHFPAIEAWFRHDQKWLAWAIMIYGLAASILPVWMLLTPRDYLSTFLKLGTVAMLAAAVVLINPTLQMLAITKFIDGSGLVFAGPVFPFVCITIACGAVSGFHSLIASGTTPKMVRRESRIRTIGYGAVVTERMG